MKKVPSNKQDNNKPVLEKPVVGENNSGNTKEPSSRGFFTEPILKKVFFFSLLLMLLITWISGFNVGWHQDEIDMNKYGKANFAYYTSGGNDTSFLGQQRAPGQVFDDPDYIDPMLRYYGCAFEYIAVGFNKLTGNDHGVNEFNTRHFFTEFLGILTLLFAGLIARKFSGWRSAIFTVWLAFLSPSFFGHFYFNTKDIPFCAGYAAALYFMISFLEEFPNPTWKTATWLMLSFYFTINTRIGGLVLFIYFILFAGIYVASKKGLLQSSIANFKAIFLKSFYIFFGGTLLMILTWPFVLMSPVKNLMVAISVIKKFPVKVNVNFEGAMVSSLEVPAHYLPKFMFITMPLLVIVLVLLGFVFYFIKRRNYEWPIASLLLFSVLFPPAYAIISHVSLYSGWRHFLFIYPCICIVAAVGLVETMALFNKQAYQLVVGAICIAALIKPVIWSIENHPYEYCYFNEIGGGFKTAYFSYDTDYWEITAKNAVDWLIKNEPIAQAKDTVVIGTNLTQFVRLYLDKHCSGAKVKVVTSSVVGRNEVWWTYGVFNSLFVKPDYLADFFPPAQTIHSENIDGLAVTAIVKDLTRLDYKALQALKIPNHPLVDSLFMAYIATTKDHNPAIDAYISVAKASTDQNEDAIVAARRALQYHFSDVIDYNAACGLGIAYANQKQFDLSISILREAEGLMPNEHYARDILQQVYRVAEIERVQSQQKVPGQQPPH